MGTKSGFIAAWSKWTGDDIAEVRQRIRALSEAKLLPIRQEPFGYADLARALLGFTAAAQHKDAAAAVRSISRLRCSAHRFLGPPGDQAVLLADRTLFRTLVEALQPPLWIVALDVDTTAGICLLTVGQGYRHTETTNVPDIQVEYTFEKQHKSTPRARNPIYPIHLSRKIYSELISHLLTDLMDHSAISISMPGSATKGRPAKGDTSA
jgi:hypothetical protein